MVVRTDKISAQTAKDSNKVNITLGGISRRMGLQNFQQHTIRKDQVIELIQMKFSRKGISINSSLHVNILFDAIQSNYLAISQSFLLKT